MADGCDVPRAAQLRTYAQRQLADFTAVDWWVGVFGRMTNVEVIHVRESQLINTFGKKISDLLPARKMPSWKRTTLRQVSVLMTFLLALAVSCGQRIIKVSSNANDDAIQVSERKKSKDPSMRIDQRLLSGTHSLLPKSNGD